MLRLPKRPREAAFSIAPAIQPPFAAPQSELDNSTEVVITDYNRSLPTFLIVGPPRTGTSWLHTALEKYTCLPRSVKETRFFDTHFHRGIKWYLAHYPASPGSLRIGEVAPTYFASAQARARIAKILPEAKVVCIFRNPVQRVISLYRLKRAYGLTPGTFEQALINDPELLASSRYATNLKAWYGMLGTDRVLATVYDDLRDSPQAYLDKVSDFIGVPRFQLTDSQVRHVHSSEALTLPRSYGWTRTAIATADWFKARHLGKVVKVVKSSPLRNLILGGGAPFADLPQEVLTRLSEIFRPEVEELEAILNRDFSAWKLTPPIAC